MRNTFGRFALPIIWDFAEVQPTSETSGGYYGAVEWISLVVSDLLPAAQGSEEAAVSWGSAITLSQPHAVDVILTHPPYYDAIIYSDVMDFFYVWLRRTVYGLTPHIDFVFAEPLAPKWKPDENDGELIDTQVDSDGTKFNHVRFMKRGCFVRSKPAVAFSQMRVAS